MTTDAIYLGFLSGKTTFTKCAYDVPTFRNKLWKSFGANLSIPRSPIDQKLAWHTFRGSDFTWFSASWRAGVYRGDLLDSLFLWSPSRGIFSTRGLLIEKKAGSEIRNLWCLWGGKIFTMPIGKHDCHLNCSWDLGLIKIRAVNKFRGKRVLQISPLKFYLWSFIQNLW